MRRITITLVAAVSVKKRNRSGLHPPPQQQMYSSPGLNTRVVQQARMLPESNEQANVIIIAVVTGKQPCQTPYRHQQENQLLETFTKIPLLKRLCKTGYERFAIIPQSHGRTSSASRWRSAEDSEGSEGSETGSAPEARTLGATAHQIKGLIATQSCSSKLGASDVHST